MKLIKLSEEHYIGVDDSEIKVGDWYYDTNDKESLMPIYQRSQDPKFYSGCKKITHSTQPLYKNDFWAIQELKLSEVKELIGEVDVEKKMISPYPVNTQNNVDWCNGYQRGYNQALEDNKDRKYTEKDLREAIFLYSAWITGGTPSLRVAETAEQRIEQIIQSLQPKTEWNVEIVDGKLKLK